VKSAAHVHDWHTSFDIRTCRECFVIEPNPDWPQADDVRLGLLRSLWAVLKGQRLYA
jgi:hypothetical protein